MLTRINAALPVLSWCLLGAIVALCLIGSAMKPQHSEGRVGKSIALGIVVIGLILAAVTI